MKTTSGFSLIELMVAIVILAIIAGIAAPSFSRMIERNRVAVATNELLSALQLARSESIRQRRPITVCLRNSAGSGCETGTDWTAGWLVQNTDGVIRVWDSVHGGITLTGLDGGVIFSPDGRTNIPSGNEFEFTVAGSGGSRQISISSTGRASAAH